MSETVATSKSVASGIYLTFDIDWAPDPVIEDTLGLLASAGVRATIFATHPTPALQDLDPTQFEIGIHPNFNPLLLGQGGDYRIIVDQLLLAFPSARGARSHSLVQSSHILDHFVDAGLQYDCNVLSPYQHGLRPHVLHNGLVRIPYFWEDDLHFTYRRPFALADLELDSNGPSVFDFHPIHIYLNTDSVETYAVAKPHTSDAAGLRRSRNSTNSGARDLLCELLGNFQELDLPTHTLGELAVATTQLIVKH